MKLKCLLPILILAGLAAGAFFFSGCAKEDLAGLGGGSTTTNSHNSVTNIFPGQGGNAFDLEFTAQLKGETTGGHINADGDVEMEGRWIVETSWKLNMSFADDVGFTFQVIVYDGFSETIVAETDGFKATWVPLAGPYKEYWLFVKIAGADIESNVQPITVPGVE